MRNLRTSVLGVAAAAIVLTTSAFAAARGDFQRTLQVNGSVNLQVETGSGSISVHPGSTNEVRVTGHIQASEWFGGNAEEKVKKLQDNPPIQQSGNDIRIGHIDDPELKHNISISYEITVPSTTQLHASTGSGNQEVSGLAGPVEATTGSGNLKIADIGAGLRAHTGSGNVELSSVKGSVFARTGSGDIHASNIAGGFDGQTGSGHLTLDQSSPGSV